MNKLLIVPFKKPSEVDIAKPLINLIKSCYNDQNLQNLRCPELANEFNKQRNAAVWKFFEKTETALDMAYTYYDQLCFLESKIPAHELQVPFKWKDAFDKGSIFGGRISLTHSSLSYEKVCVLFNIAALQSALAQSQGNDSDESLKKGAKLYQQSAGIFHYLKGVTPAVIPSEPTPDLSPETLNVLCTIMLAQAQEVFISKAIKDNMKEISIAKLCCQAEELYSEALAGMQKDSLKNLWEKDWIAIIAAKQAGFHAMYQFYVSLSCRESKKIGEEISRLQEAVELFKTSSGRASNLTLFETCANRAQKNLAESIKDNNFIYNEMIPDVKILPSPGKIQLAKSLPLKLPLKSDSKDMFSHFVPVAVHQALSAADAKKNEIVSGEIAKLREETHTLNAVLASLNLPAALENADRSTGLPPSLLEKSKILKEKGGAESIKALIKDLPELLTRNREILDEAERMLDEERDSDNQMRAHFKERWTRIPSDKLTEMFRSNAKKYREVINNAVEADKIVRGKFDTHVHGIELLSMSCDKIQEAIPSTGKTVDINIDSVQKLKSLMEIVEGLKNERDEIEKELKSANVDILKEEFLKALNLDGGIKEPEISTSGIGKILSPLQAKSQKSIEQQKSLIVEIQEAHKSFIEETGTDNGSREKLFSDLATAYDSFIELQSNLQEGTKFYNDLTQLLIVFQNKISDFCFARKTEKEELLKDLTKETSRVAPEPTPQVPSHFGGIRTDSTDTSSMHSGGSTVPTGGNVPYPTQLQGMPMPYGASNTPYPTYVPPPMPQGFNPYATLPYPNSGYYTGFPQGPQVGNYGTYPGSYAAQQQGGNPAQQKPPGW